MYRNFIFVCLMIISFVFQATAATEVLNPASVNLNKDHPTYFTENKGQWDERVLFKAEAEGGLTWFVEKDGVTLLQSKFSFFEAA